MAEGADKGRRGRLLAWYQAMGADEAIGEEPVTALPRRGLQPAPGRASARAESTVVTPPRPAPKRPSATIGARDRRRGLDACSSLKLRRELRWLLAEAHRQEPVLRQRQRSGSHHADRRGARPRRGFARKALCRPRRATARPHARIDRAIRGAGLHHQHRLLAPAGQPHADAGGDRGLRPVPARQIELLVAVSAGAARRRRGEDHPRCRAKASCGFAANG